MTRWHTLALFVAAASLILGGCAREPDFSIRPTNTRSPSEMSPLSPPARSLSNKLKSNAVEVAKVKKETPSDLQSLPVPAPEPQVKDPQSGQKDTALKLSSPEVIKAEDGATTLPPVIKGKEPSSPTIVMADASHVTTSPGEKAFPLTSPKATDAMPYISSDPRPISGDTTPVPPLPTDTPLIARVERTLPEPANLSENARKGWQILENTPAALADSGEGALYSGNALSCSSCHLEGGRRPSALPLMRSTSRYPRYTPREGRVVTLEERVNACIIRGLNASPLSGSSPEMEGIIAYLQAIALDSGEEEPFGIEPPDRAADLLEGETVYRRSCQSCHAPDGQGRLAESGSKRPVPPLWGPESYATGSPLHGVLTAAAFIQANMPFETMASSPILTAEEAYDVAALINSFERPVTPGLSRDYPALTEKPVDCPYPPYPDPFSDLQHKYGPYTPILAEWELYRNAERWVFWAPRDMKFNDPPILLQASTHPADAEPESDKEEAIPTPP